MSNVSNVPSPSDCGAAVVQMKQMDRENKNITLMERRVHLPACRNSYIASQFKETSRIALAIASAESPENLTLSRFATRALMRKSNCANETAKTNAISVKM